MKFKVGDSVRILDGSHIINYRGGFTYKMKKYIGRICTINGISEHDTRRHTGYYLKEVGYLWDERGLELVKPETIVIYRKGNETIALDKRTGRKAVAKCCPDDTYNFDTGAELAFKRLMDVPPFESKRPLNAKIIFTKGDSTFETGHIYEIKDGKLKCPYGGSDLPESKEYGGAFYSIEDVRDYFTGIRERKHHFGWSFITLEFIEVVE